MVHKGFKTLTKTPIKTKHLSIMNLTFYLVFFILLTSCCFTSALKCYRCEEKNTDFCSRLDNKNSWEIVDCSGSCFSGARARSPSLQGRTRFVNQTYFCNIILQIPTVMFIFLYTPSFLLEIRAIIKISSHPWNHINCD